MKIALVSDLHLEFAPVTIPNTEKADVLLLAGDIVPIAYLRKWRTDATARSVKKHVDAFIAETISQYDKVYHVMGNHEYYHGFWNETIPEFFEFWDTKAKNVIVLDKNAVSLEDGLPEGVPQLRLWGATLWTDFAGGNVAYMEAVRDGMNDYHLIKLEESSPSYKLRPSDTQEDHEEARYGLKEALEARPDDKWIVMTHHLPSWQSIPERFKGSLLNYGYASDMDKFIEDHPQISTWVHGHTHNNMDYTIGGTRILCNPRGYASPNHPNSPENTTFNPSFIFEV